MPQRHANRRSAGSRVRAPRRGLVKLWANCESAAMALCNQHGYCRPNGQIGNYCSFSECALAVALPSPGQHLARHFCACNIQRRKLHGLVGAESLIIHGKGPNHANPTPVCNNGAASRGTDNAHRYPPPQACMHAARRPAIQPREIVQSSLKWTVILPLLPFVCTL